LARPKSSFDTTSVSRCRSTCSASTFHQDHRPPAYALAHWSARCAPHLTELSVRQSHSSSPLLQCYQRSGIKPRQVQHLWCHSLIGVCLPMPVEGSHQGACSQRQLSFGDYRAFYGPEGDFELVSPLKAMFPSTTLRKLDGSGCQRRTKRSTKTPTTSVTVAGTG
jgi:hypothetical protein